MRLSPASWLALLLTGVSAAIAAWAWMNLPPGGGLQMNYLGIDGSRHVVTARGPLLVIPLISLVVTLALSTARLRQAADVAAQPLEMTMISVAGLLLVTEIALVGRAFNPGFNVMQPVAAATGVLLIAIGNYLGKARRNAVFGLRTPWTLADSTVWDRTHRFTGAGMVVGGVVLIALSLALRTSEAIGAAIVVCAAGPLLAGVVRSAGLYRNMQRS